MIPQLIRKYAALTTIAALMEHAKGGPHDTFSTQMAVGFRRCLFERATELLSEMRQIPATQRVDGGLIDRIEDRMQNDETDKLMEEIGKLLALVAEAEMTVAA